MPDKLEEIASIMSEIHKGTRPGSIKFIFGDGFYPHTAIRSRDKIIEQRLSQGKNISNVTEEDKLCWKLYDTYRIFSANHLPPLVYYYIHYLCRNTNVSSLISTNYDLRFDSIFAQDPLPQAIVLNPIINDGDDSGDDFYGKISDATTKLRYWKIHGSFSHISFIDSVCGFNHIYKLPHPRVNLIYADKAIQYDNFFQSLNLRCSCNRMAHLIDMNFHRTAFSRVIDGAISDLNSSDTGIVIIIGFTGRYDTLNPTHPWNEELVPHLINLSDNLPVYTILAPFQKRKDSDLYRELDSNKTALQGDMQDILSEILINYFNSLSIDGTTQLEEIDKQYIISWKDNSLFNPIPY